MSKKEKEKPTYSGISNILYALRFNWRYAREVVICSLLLYPIGLVLKLADMYFPKLLIDGITARRSVLYIVLTVIVFHAGTALIGVLQSFFNLRTSAGHYHVSNVVQNHLSQKRMRGDFQKTDDPDVNLKYGRAVNDASSGQCAVEFLQSDLRRVVSAFLEMFSCAAIISIASPWIILTVMIEAVISYILSRANMKYSRSLSDENADINRRKNYIAGFSSDFGYAKDIRIYGMRRWIDSLFRKYQHDSLILYKSEQKRWCAQSLTDVFLGVARNGVSYFFLVKTLFDGGITAGDFVFMFSAVGALAAALSQIFGQINSLHDKTVKIGWYREYFDIPDRFNHSAGQPLPEKSQMPLDIEFKNVSFKYPTADGEHYALKNINLKIKAGERLAIVGRNGAGKTTLVKLLCGLYYPSEGEILLGGINIKKFNIDEYYGLISAVFQDIYILPLTVAQFVAGTDLDENVNRPRVMQCLEKAGLGDKIKSLAKGIDSRLMKGIYDDSIELSGGEKQKLMLARAIYKDAGIVILDEPTAALDPIAENEVYQKYSDLTEDATSLYISHRLASTRFCDRIIYLEDGEIKEIGSHAELMSRGGKYAYMFELQAKYYREGENDEKER